MRDVAIGIFLFIYAEKTGNYWFVAMWFVAIWIDNWYQKEKAKDEQEE